MKIAEEILYQLGGNRFAVMTGANGFVDHGNALSFRIGRNMSKTNYIKVTLNGDDLYTMTFKYIPREPNYLALLEKCIAKGIDFDTEWKRRTAHKVVREFQGVYFDQLQELFTEVTGMRTHL